MENMENIIPLKIEIKLNNTKNKPLTDQQKLSIKKLLLEKKSISEIGRELDIKKWVVYDYYKQLLDAFGDTYKLPTVKTIYERFIEGGTTNILDTNFGRSLKKLENFNINFRVFIKQFTDRVNNNDLTVEVKCSNCGKIMHKNYSGLIKCVKTLSIDNGVIYCHKCYNQRLSDPIYVKLNSPNTFVGIPINKGNYKYKSGDFMIDDKGREIYCASAIVKVNGGSKQLKLFSYKKYGTNCMIFAAIFRDCYIVLNDLNNCRNFSDEELFEYLKKYDMLTEYNEIKNKLSNVFNDLFVEE